MERPDQEEVDATMKETQAALDQLVSGKVMAQQPKTLPQQPGAPTYLKYKPLHSGPQFNSGAEHRIIKMQDMPIDPMEPPKFRHKKVRSLFDRAYLSVRRFQAFLARGALLAWLVVTLTCVPHRCAAVHATLSLTCVHAPVTGSQLAVTHVCLPPCRCRARQARPRCP